MNLTTHQNATVYLDSYSAADSGYGDCNGDALDPDVWSCGDDVSGSSQTAMGVVDGYCVTLCAGMVL